MIRIYITFYPYVSMYLCVSTMIVFEYVFIEYIIKPERKKTNILAEYSFQPALSNLFNFLAVLALFLVC